MRKLLIIPLFLLAFPMLVYAQNKHFASTTSIDCNHGLQKQPDGGPFSVFVFCDDALGAYIGVILTEPGGGPGNIPSKIWGWENDNRFWQVKDWASDVTGYIWSPDMKSIFMATSSIYGDGGLYRLDLVNRSYNRIFPKREHGKKSDSDCYISKIIPIDGNTTFRAILEDCDGATMLEEGLFDLK